MRPELDRRSTIQRSLQEATEDINAKLSSKDDHAKASVRDPPDLMREKALLCCEEPPSVWRDTKKPSVLQTWNAYWEKDYFCKHEGYFYYKAYTGKTRVLKLDPFATITEVKAAIEQKEGTELPTGFLKFGATVLAKEDLDLNEYNVRPGSLFELPSRLYGGGNGDDARVDANTSLSTNQDSERATASVVESTGALEGNLPEGDPPERIRTALNSASPQRQDHATTAEPEPEPQVDAEPEPQPEVVATKASEIVQSDPRALTVSPRERVEFDTPNTPSQTILAHKPSPVERAPSLRWLQHFAGKHRDRRFTFTRRDFVDAAHGGGNQHGIDITADKLDAFRSARRAAEKTGTGKPVMVRYVDIPFENMTTADVMEAIVRPVCRKHHKSYAEAVIMPDAVGFIGDPTYFVSTFPNCFVQTRVYILTQVLSRASLQASHAWDSLFIDLFKSLSAFLEGAAKDETFVWLVCARTSFFVR